MLVTCNNNTHGTKTILQCLAFTSFLEIELSPSNCSDGDVRLIGGSNEFEGTVEVCLNRVWGSVCGSNTYYYYYYYYYYHYYNYWNVQEGQVVCGQLGHQRLGMQYFLQYRILCI